MNNDSKLRTAVIGLGMGRLHAQTLLKDENAELVAIADLDEGRHAEFSPQIGKENCYTDFEQMLAAAKPDLAIIALPNFLHKSVTIKCLEAGCHVLCEKPMAMTVPEAEEMKAAAEKAGKTLGINFSFRFRRESFAVKDIVDRGGIGTPYHAYTRWTRRSGIPGFGGWFGQKDKSGGGPLIDLGVHRIDLAMWLMGHPKPVAVSGVTHKAFGVLRAEKEGKLFDVEDYASGIVRFENGASLIFEVSWAGFQEEKETMQTRVMGTEGAVIEGQWGSDSIVRYSFEKTGHDFTTDVFVNRWGHFRNSINEMVHCVKEGKPFMATADDGIKVQQILHGLYRSAELGREVRMDELS